MLECFRRIGHADLRRLDRLAEIRRNKNRRSARLAQLRHVFRIAKNEISPNVASANEAAPVMRERGISEQLAARFLREFLQSKDHSLGAPSRS